jgi:cell division protein FtsB
VLYVDHTADSKFGGFRIATTERCIKATTSFSRFRFELAPTAEATHLVSEDAAYTSVLSDPASVQALLDREEEALLEAGVLTAADAAELRAFVSRHALLGCLTKLARADERMEESVVHGWKTQGSPLPAALLSRATQCVQMHAQLAQLRAQVSSHNAHIEIVLSDQSRLRQNILSLEKVGKCNLLDRYLKDLDRGEDDILANRKQIDKLRDTEADVRAKLRALKMEIDSHVSKLRAEHDLWP